MSKNQRTRSQELGARVSSLRDLVYRDMGKENAVVVRGDEQGRVVKALEKGQKTLGVYNLRGWRN
jgi:hypothetical protein